MFPTISVRIFVLTIFLLQRQMDDAPMDDNQDSPIILYQTEDGETHIQVTMQDETVWLTQKQMAELFQRNNLSFQGISTMSLKKVN